jgi:predicted nucleic acid-binding Zn ribbon protein
MGEYCLDCGEPVESDDRFCYYCGERLGVEETERDTGSAGSTQRYCIDCGEPAESDDRYCYFCGEPLQ